MKPEELRIGNRVSHHTQGDIPITAWGIHCFYEETARPRVKLKPIPLTETWLLDVGFENSHSSVYHKGRVAIMVGHDVGFILIDDAQPSYKIAELKYVHQLQNLYYAIEQTDLI
jgi:hypothetical protein